MAKGPDIRNASVTRMDGRAANTWCSYLDGGLCARKPSPTGPYKYTEGDRCLIDSVLEPSTACIWARRRRTMLVKGAGEARAATMTERAQTLSGRRKAVPCFPCPADTAHSAYPVLMLVPCNPPSISASHAEGC